MDTVKIVDTVKKVDTQVRTLRIYVKMLEDDQQGLRLLYRPKDWNVVVRRKEKESKKYGLPKGDTLPPYLSPQLPTVNWLPY